MRTSGRKKPAHISFPGSPERENNGSINFSSHAGSSRTPLWRKGGTVFGPQPRSYEFKVNKKIRALALKMALSAKVAGESLIVVDKLELPEIKTKLFSGVAGSLGLKKALIVLGDSNNTIELSARNLPGPSICWTRQ